MVTLLGILAMIAKVYVLIVLKPYVYNVQEGLMLMGPFVNASQDISIMGIIVSYV
jgi:hypothetical protein